MAGNLKIIVSGGFGQLGRSLDFVSSKYDYDIIFFDKKELDITNFTMLKGIIHKHEPNVFINCAAYTDLVKCESNQSIANLTNNISLKGIVSICKKYNIKLIHISTDFVFDGKKEPHM